MDCSVRKTIRIRLLEFFIVLILSIIFLSKVFFYLSAIAKYDLDDWHQCFMLEYQAARILGLNPGGLWEGGFFYPFHKSGILLGEPLWGVSLLISPIWAISENVFHIFRLGGIPAVSLAWICTYYFAKGLGCARIWAFCAAATFCLSGVSLILVLRQCAFWPLFIVPLLGMITLKVFSTSKLRWGVLWGIIFGYLAWSSVHIFVMGGVFLCLFILWNILFTGCSKKALAVLLCAFIISGIISAIILIPMFLLHTKFNFPIGYYQLSSYSSNFANLIYREWPNTPLNPISKTQVWDYLKTSAKGATNIGVSASLLFAALTLFVIRLKASMPLRKEIRHSWRVFAITIFISVLLAFFNMRSFAAKYTQLKMPLPELASGLTYLIYALTGSIIYILRQRIRLAIKSPDFFFLLSMLLFGLLSFGPYYLINNGKIIASPVNFLIYHVPAFAGIRATARWGLMFSFALSMAVAVFLSRNATGIKLKTCAVILMLASILELSPGFQILGPKILFPYKWSPRQTDIFLKNIPDNGAVLEISSYPVKQDHGVASVNSLGYSIFSHLYHKKPLVAGYSSYTPHASYRHLFDPKDKTLSPGIINTLRKFGARYWVFHIEDWSSKEIRLLQDSTSELMKISELDDGKTLIFEDPFPKASVGYFDVK